MDNRYRASYAEIYRARTTVRPRKQFGVAFGEKQFGVAFGEKLGRRDPNWSTVIADAIDAAEGEITPISIREDGKALLAVNFEDLVLLPLFLGGATLDTELFDDVREDILMLVKNAAEVSIGDDHISGHKLIDSLSRNWENLRISRFALWETLE
jgi:hypothetical protein